MKYMIMMNTPRDGYAQFMSWPKEILEAHFAFMEVFGQKLRASGELVSAEGLASPVQAKAVRIGKGGKPVTDGVFPESKEFLAGYWIVDVDRPERAYEIAGEVLDAPHGTVTTSGAPFEMVIEVREVLGSHQDLS
jgi:hypothetical protein